MEASIITTYRCNSKCFMCNIWKYPTEEIKDVYKSLKDTDYDRIHEVVKGVIDFVLDGESSINEIG